MYSLFLSSTFNDLHRERDLFHRSILPRLNEFLKKYGQSLQLCDLRWGIDTTDMDEADCTKKILDVCFDSISHTVPFFAAILGNRYGWIPPAEQTSFLQDYQLEDHRQSVTEMEIEYHKIASGGLGNKALFFFREDLPKEEMTEETRRIYFSAAEEDARKLERLKQTIRAENPGRCFSYTVCWDKEAQDYAAPDFEEVVFQAFGQMFETCFGALPRLSPEEEALNESRACFEKQAGAYGEDYPVLQAFLRDMRERYLKTDDPRLPDRSDMPPAVAASFAYTWDLGEGGVSALVRDPEVNESCIAEIYRYFEQRREEPLLRGRVRIFPVPFVCGVNMNAADGYDLQACLVAAAECELLRASGVVWQDGADRHAKASARIDPKTIGYFTEKYQQPEARERYYLSELLQLLQTEHHLVPLILIDHFEKLTDAYAEKLMFRFDNGRICPSYVIDMDETTWKRMDYLRMIRGWGKRYRIHPLTPEEQASYVDSFFGSISHSLPAAAKEKLLENPSAGNPAWLRSACDVLSELDRADFDRVHALGDGIGAITRVLGEKAEALPHSQTELVYERLKAFFAGENAQDGSFLLWMLAPCRFGLSVGAMEKIAEAAGMPVKTHVLERMLRRFPLYFHEYTNGLIRFSVPRMETLIPTGDLDAFRGNLRTFWNVLYKLPPDAPEYFTECLRCAVQLKNVPWMDRILRRLIARTPRHRFEHERVLLGILPKSPTWLAGDGERALSKPVLSWIVNSFLPYAQKEGRAKDYREFAVKLAASGLLGTLDYIRCLGFISVALLKEKDLKTAQQLFATDFKYISKYAEKRPLAFTEILNNYLEHVRRFKNADETAVREYAQLCFTLAKTLEPAPDTIGPVVRAYDHYLSVFGGSMELLEANALYQSVFDMYEAVRETVCYRPRERTRWLLPDLRDVYMEDYARFARSYAEFLIKNEAAFPPDLEIPCFWSEYVNAETEFHDGQKTTTVDRLELHDSGTIDVVLQVYLNDAASGFSEMTEFTHEQHWLETAAELMFRLGKYRLSHGICRKKEDAYACFEKAMLCRRSLGDSRYLKKDAAEDRFFEAYYLMQMSDAAELHVHEEERKLSLPAARQAASIYLTYSDYVTDELDLFCMAKALIRVAEAETEDPARAGQLLARAGRALLRIPNRGKPYLEIFRDLFKAKVFSSPFCDAPVGEISAEKLRDVFVYQLLWAETTFYGKKGNDWMFVLGKDERAMDYFVCKVPEALTDGTSWYHACGAFACHWAVFNSAGSDEKPEEYFAAFEALVGAMPPERQAALLPLPDADGAIRYIETHGLFT